MFGFDDHRRHRGFGYHHPCPVGKERKEDKGLGYCHQGTFRYDFSFQVVVLIGRQRKMNDGQNRNKGEVHF